MGLKEDMCYRRQERVIESRLVLFFCIGLVEEVARDSIESITKHSEVKPVQSRITLNTQLLFCRRIVYRIQWCQC